MPENISDADGLASKLLEVKNNKGINSLTTKIKRHIRNENPLTFAKLLVYYAKHEAKGLPTVKIDEQEFNYFAIAEQIAKGIDSTFQQAFTRAAFAYQLKLHSKQLRYNMDGSKHNLGDYVFEMFDYYKLESVESNELEGLLLDLKLELSFFIYLDELLQYCERDTILKLFNVSRFEDLPGKSKEIEETLKKNLNRLLLNFYVVVAQIIKGKEELNNEERHNMEKLTEHIIGVYTSLLQLYYMEKHEEARFERLYIGGESVAARLKKIFKEHYLVDDALQFKKWAFIVFFHDIGKFEESLPGYNRKHDLVSAEIIQDWGIIDWLCEMDKDDKKEIILIIKKHVDVGCHGPADHSLTRLNDLFWSKEVYTYFTGPRGNIEFNKLRRFFHNALLMWAHDAAGTTKIGVATAPPFIYLERIFGEIIDKNKGVAVGKNVYEHRDKILSAIENMARKKFYDRMGRIISAWAKNDNLSDIEAEDKFKKCFKELAEKDEISKNDLDIFPKHFYCISGANHIFNMLVHPVRNNERYRDTVKGLVLLTKAAVELKVEEIRAVNKGGVMELDANRRERMAEILMQEVSCASSVMVTEKRAWFVDSRGRKIKSNNVEMLKYEEEGDGSKFLMVKIMLE